MSSFALQPALNLRGTVSFGGNFSARYGDAPMSFDVETYPADPMPGEAVTFRVVNVAGLPSGIYEYLQTAVLVDFGDPGATYESGGGLSSDANSAMGRVSAHVYEAAGSYTATVTLHAVGAAPATRTVNITVADATLTHDYYVDFGEVSGTPDFSFAPAAGGIVSHVSSAAALNAISLRGTGQAYRLTFKDDETFEDVLQIIDRNSTYIIRRSGGGAKPVFKFSDSTSTSERTVFRCGSGANRLVAIGLEGDGRFNPVSGEGPAGLCQMFSSDGTPTADRFISLWRCKGRGMEDFYGGGGGYSSLGDFTAHFRMIDCDHADWSNFGVSWFGAHVAPCVVGNSFKQNPLAMQRSASKGVLPDGPDHGPSRIQHQRWGVTENNTMIGASGWSALAPGYSIQSCNRIHSFQPEQQADWEGCYHRNKGVGSAFVSIGSVNDSDAILAVKPKAIMVTHNEMDTGRQGFNGFASLDCANVYVGDNIWYRANVYDGSAKNPYFIKSNAGTTVFPDPTVLDGDLIALGNTVISDQTAVAGDNGAFSLFGLFGTWGGTLNQVDANNFVHTAGHTSGVDRNADMSRGDGFKLLTGSALFGSATTDLTPLDFDLTARVSPTSPGAWHTGVSSALAVSDAVNTSAPTITALAAFPDEFGVDFIGAWSNVDPEKLHLMEYNWKLDGTAITTLPSGGTHPSASKIVNPKFTTGAGDLTCTIVMTNRSGVRVEATSNTITI